MAICGLGNLPHRFIANWKRRSQIRSSRHRLLHEVDRSQTSGDNYLEESLGLRGKEHHMSIWGAKEDCPTTVLNSTTICLLNFAKKKGIIKSFSSVAHPQENGQVEAVNKTLKSSMKKKLEEAKGKWPEELP